MKEITLCELLSLKKGDWPDTVKDIIVRVVFRSGEAVEEFTEPWDILPLLLRKVAYWQFLPNGKVLIAVYAVLACASCPFYPVETKDDSI